MKKIYEFSNYKEFLSDFLHSEHSPRGLQTQFAKHLNCQSAYVYQVLKGKSELTEDQAFLATTFLKLDSSETAYFLNLIRLSKSLSKESQEYYSQELSRIKQLAAQLVNNSDAEIANDNESVWSFYFSDPNISIIHFLTECPEYQNLETLSKKVKMDQKIVYMHLQNLQKFGLVVAHEDKWVNSKRSVHFDKSSLYNSSLHLLRRTQVLSSLLKTNQERDIHFSSQFALDKKTFEELKIFIVEKIKEIQTKIHQGGSEEVYIFTLDMVNLLETQ